MAASSGVRGPAAPPRGQRWDRCAGSDGPAELYPDHQRLPETLAHQPDSRHGAAFSSPTLTLRLLDSCLTWSCTPDTLQ